MASHRSGVVLVLQAVLVWCLFAAVVHAQTYSLSGKVTDTATHPVPSATVSAKSARTGKTYTAKTNADGLYTFPALPHGDFQVWAVAGELQAPPVKVTPAPGQMIDLTMSPAPAKRGTAPHGRG